MALLRSILLACFVVGGWAADLRSDVAALADPAQRDQAWERLVKASELHGLIDGRPSRVWPTAPGSSSRLVTVERATEQVMPLQTPMMWTPDVAADRWPRLDLATLLPEEGQVVVPDPTIEFDRLTLYRVSADGRIDQVDADLVLDLDGDGTAESLVREGISIDGRQEVFGIIIRRHDTTPPRVIFHLLCPYQEFAWRMRVRQIATKLVIQAGPTRDVDLQPVVSIAWDPVHRDWTWSGPAACRRIPVDTDAAVVAAIAGTLPRSAPIVVMPLDERVACALSRPYTAGSSAGHNTAGILAWMGPGRTWADLQAKHISTPQFPDACWIQPPAEAALTFARANRRQSDEALSPISVVPMTAPQHGLAVVETWCSAHGRGDGCSSGFIAVRVAGNDSYLINATSWRQLDWSHTELESSYRREVHFTQLTEVVARQAVAVALHLVSIRELHHRGSSHQRSSEAQSGALFVDDVMALGGTLAYGAPAEWSSGDLDEEARFNLVALWFRRAIREHIAAAPSLYDQNSIAEHQRVARLVLTRWRSGIVPDAIATIAAELLTDADAPDVAELLGDLPSEAPQPLREARERSVRRLAIASDDKNLLAVADAPGIDRIWAIRRIAQRDPALAQSRITDAAAHETDPTRVIRWTSWGTRVSENRLRQRAPTSLAVPVTWQMALVAPAVVESPAERSASAKTLSDGLADHRIAIEPLLLAVWAYDLRELRGQIQALATAGPNDQEGPRVATSGGGPEPQCARYHLARQILSLWDEPDAATRARLLCAFALHRQIDPTGDGPASQRLAASFTSCGETRRAAHDIITGWTSGVPQGLFDALK